MRKSYVQGLVQRRVKYRFDLAPPQSIKAWRERFLDEFKSAIEAEWRGRLCVAEELPSLGLLLIEWMGGNLLADVSICAPISHPPPPPFLLDVLFNRVDICIEPIAPTFPPSGYVVVYTEGVKQLGRVTLRRRHAVVKYRGLLFATEVKYRGDLRGGVVLEIAQYSCSRYELWRGLKKLKTILYKT
ncbi:MAG: hypothetical protein QXF78_01940 [Pyrobaculum sp.]